MTWAESVRLRDSLVRLARDAAARKLHALAAMYAEAVVRNITERRSVGRGDRADTRSGDGWYARLG